MAVDITLNELLAILFGIATVLGGVVGWALKRVADEAKGRTRLEDRTMRNEKDISDLQVWMKEERAEAKSEHEAIRAEIKELARELHTLSGTLKK